MIVDITSFFSDAGKEGTMEVRVDADSFKSKMGSFPIVKKEPFMLLLSNVENKRLLISGETDITLKIPCDRCLTDVPVTLHLVLEKELSLEEDGAPQEEGQDNLEQSEYLNGYQLDVDRLVYGEILVMWPMKVLCREDCKGICSKCGANLNVSPCKCDRTALDPRMAAFQDVFNKFKEV